MKDEFEKEDLIFKKFDGNCDDPIFYIAKNLDKMSVKEAQKLIQDYDSKCFEEFLANLDCRDKSI